MNLAEHLKEAREKVGYSQQDVAEKLNVSRQAVSRWENGKTYPDIENLVILSQLYKTSIDDLLENKFTESTKEDSPENKPIEPVKEDSGDITTKLEQFFIVAVSLLSCTVPVAGLFLNIGLCVYCYMKKIKLKPICWIILLYCIIINISNLYTVLSIEIPSWGKGNIEKISKI